MATNHNGGNIQPGLDLEEHDGLNNAKRVVISAVSVSIPITTAGNVTLDPGSRTGILGNVTLSDSKTYIGLTTTTLGVGDRFIGLTTVVQASSARTITGNVTLSDSKTYIGLTTITHGSNVTLNPSSANIGSVSILGGSIAVAGNATLSDSKTYIGLTTTTLGIGTQFIGLATVVQSSSVRSILGNVTVQAVDLDIRNLSSAQDSVAIVGNVTVQAVDLDIRNLSASQDNVALIGNVTLSDSKGYIGLATVNVATIAAGANYIGLVSINGSVVNLASNNNIGSVSVLGGSIAITGNVTLTDAKTYVGLTTTTLGVGTTFIGLVTANSRNAGTTKTLIPLPITLSTSSVATIAVPSNLFKVTQLLLNSDATVRLSLKSGVTYLTGNASLGVTLNPGGGWVESGSPDSPVYIGLANAASLVVEKFDMTGTKANIGGKIIYFDE